MKPAAFEYFAVSTVDEAIATLVERGPEARILAGGQSLIPMMKLRILAPTALVDINRVHALDYLKVDGSQIAIGATCRFHAVLQADAISQRCGLLREAARHVVPEAIRHRGTICGSLAHADPVAEMPLIACCLDADIIVRGHAGVRTISARDFFVSLLTTSLQPDELLTEVLIPTLEAGTGWGFRELKRPGNIALAAVTLRRSAKDRVSGARIALGAVADRPTRALAAEAALVGEPGNQESFRAAAALAIADLDPPADMHGSGHYRKKVAGVLLERALADAWGRTSG
jgi:carbon-monoxide dehydrogenase medium subunit